MDKVAITGANGFVGTHLCQALCEKGYDVRGLVRSRAKADFLSQLGVDIAIGDVTQPATLGTAVADCSVVYHLAGLTKAARLEQFLEVNAVGTRNLLEACAARPNPPVVVLVSTLAVAGPAIENRVHIEKDLAAPVSQYGRSKLVGEREAAAFAGKVPVTIVRPPMVCGERDREMHQLFDVVRRWGVMTIPGFRHHRYSIIHARDLSEALIKLADVGERVSKDSREIGQGIYYAANDEQLTLLELGNLMAEAMDQRPPMPFYVPPNAARAASAIVAGVSRLRGQYAVFNPDKVREALAGSWICSAEKLKHLIGTFASPIRDRLRQTAGWYLDQGWLRRA